MLIPRVEMTLLPQDGYSLRLEILCYLPELGIMEPAQRQQPAISAERSDVASQVDSDDKVNSTIIPTRAQVVISPPLVSQHVSLIQTLPSRELSDNHLKRQAHLRSPAWTPHHTSTIPPRAFLLEPSHSHP
ncbi:hypothetical protein FNV43_RR26709 [Rhamnella rubrinervis]|uniref:Uncharacterized protein n=1 Tax=Rhamnella rubrinervis TaxID=2594499 RepID=A0A8K0DPU0_9ROSA|nr:hypothetical protein FNV43_RR26709 [Rhamnella rubrinervis]